MSEDKPIIYVDAGNFNEFLQMQKDSDFEYLFIADETFLRARTPGLIERIGNFHMRWNYQPISEMIDRAKIDWSDFFEEEELRKQMRDTGLSQEDTEYGVGD